MGQMSSQRIRYLGDPCAHQRGLGNAEIAERLSISDKTVRNHVSNLFDKLGVWTRAQAIVFARDRGFAGVGPR